MKNTSILLFALLFLVGCKEEKEPAFKNLIEKITNEQIILASGETIQIPPNGGDKTVLFIICSGEYDPKPEGEIMDLRLNENGQNLATMISGLLKDVKMEGGVLASMHPVANQYGQLIGDPNGWKTFNYNTIDYGAFLDYIYDIKKGNRFLVIEDPRTLNKLLTTLTGVKEIGTERTPNFGERKIWYVETSSRTNAIIRELGF